MIRSNLLKLGQVGSLLSIDSCVEILELCNKAFLLIFSERGVAGLLCSEFSLMHTCHLSQLGDEVLLLLRES